MAYEKLSAEDRAKMVAMDNGMQDLIAKLRADAMTDPAIKQGLRYICTLAFQWYRTIGYKRIGEALCQLYIELFK